MGSAGVAVELFVASLAFYAWLLIEPGIVRAVLMNVMLIAGTRPLVNTVLALKDHGVFLLAGPHYQEGILVIAIGAGTTLQASARTP